VKVEHGFNSRVALHAFRFLRKIIRKILRCVAYVTYVTCVA